MKDNQAPQDLSIDHLTPSSLEKLDSEAFGVIEFVSGATLASVEALESQHAGSSLTKLILRSLQAGFRGKFWKELNDMAGELRQKGKLLTSKDSSEVLEMGTELASAIDKVETPDQEVLNAAKNLFLYGMLKSTSVGERYLAKRFLQITKELHGDDILILRACYTLYSTHKGGHNYPNDVDTWAKRVSENVGHKIMYLVLNRENTLMTQNLIGPRTQTDRSGIACGSTGRLTDLGIRYCEFLKNADESLSI